jgi:hypothetical protein
MALKLVWHPSVRGADSKRCRYTGGGGITCTDRQDRITLFVPWRTYPVQPYFIYVPTHLLMPTLHIPSHLHLHMSIYNVVLWCMMQLVGASTGAMGYKAELGSNYGPAELHGILSFLRISRIDSHATSVYFKSCLMNAPNRYELYVLDEGEKP